MRPRAKRACSSGCARPSASGDQGPDLVAREAESYAQGMAVSRRTVTVLFADVADSTPLGERLDPESLRQVMSRYFERMGAVLERHGGTAEKVIGGALVAKSGENTAEIQANSHTLIRL